MKYDFNVRRMKGKAQIDIDRWLYSKDELMEIHRINGRSHVTYFSELNFVQENSLNLRAHDYVLLSKVACDIATTPTAFYQNDGHRYFNVPLEQIVGVFPNHEITLENLKMTNKNILFERVDRVQDSSLIIKDENTMFGKIIKADPNSFLRKGSLVLIRDNMSTPIRFNNKEYFAVEEKFVLGVSDLNQSIEDIKFINNYILMKPYISSKVLNSTILETAAINYEDLDYSDINNRNLFKVYYQDENFSGINKEDILLLNRDFTNYVYYNNEKYFVIDNKKYIAAKIERDEQCN